MTAGDSQKETMAIDLKIEQILRLLQARVVWISVGIAAFTVLGFGVGLLWPKTYEAEATVFPVVSSANSSAQFANLASLAGISLGTSMSGPDPGRTLAALLDSRLLAEKLVADMELTKVVLTTRPELARLDSEQLRKAATGLVRQALRHRTDLGTGVISITVAWPDAETAQKICNRLVTILDDLLVEKSLTTGRKRTENLEKQIELQRSKVDSLQNEMALFQRDTKLLDPKAQSTQMIQNYSDLVQQKMGLEMKLASIQQSYSSDNARVLQIQSQIVNITGQIEQMKTQVNGDLPSLRSTPDNLVKYQNLARDLDIASRLYAGLLASMEQEKLSDDSDQIYVEVLDRAELPTSGNPRIVVVVLLFFVLGFLTVPTLAVLPVLLQRNREQ